MTPSPRRAIRNGDTVRFFRNRSRVQELWQQVWLKKYPTPQIAGKAVKAWEAEMPRMI